MRRSVGKVRFRVRFMVRVKFIVTVRVQLVLGFGIHLGLKKLRVKNF